MGEIIGPALLVIAIVVALVWAAMWRQDSARQRRKLINAPALLLPDGEPPDVLLANAQRMHTIAQRSARLLDRITNDTAVQGLRRDDRKEAEAILKDFYSN